MSALRAWTERGWALILAAVHLEEEEEMMSQFAQSVIASEKPKWEQTFRQEGRLEGEAKGEAKLLFRQLSRRFQPLPDGTFERIHGADPSTIEIWADRVLDAKSLDEVFTE